MAKWTFKKSRAAHKSNTNCSSATHDSSPDNVCNGARERLWPIRRYWAIPGYPSNERVPGYPGTARVPWYPFRALAGLLFDEHEGAMMVQYGMVNVNLHSASSHSLLMWSYVVVLNAGDTREVAVCHSGYFRAKCAWDELVVVARARYGRMRINQCVSENFGYVGCSIDVIDVLDRYCSGRRTCHVRVLDETFTETTPCHEDLNLYLQVEYQCVRGTRSQSPHAVYIYISTACNSTEFYCQHIAKKVHT